MVNASLLSELHDIHLPQPLSWWPPAIGWCLLSFLALLLVLFSVYRAYKRYRANQAKREALYLWEKYYHSYQETLNTQQASANLSSLLRRVALAYYPRVEVAGLKGQAWTDFLTQCSKQINFQELQAFLLETPYQSQSQLNAERLFQYTKQWIKERRVVCLN